MNPLQNTAAWPVWAKFLAVALALYGALLCFVSLSVVVSALRQGQHLRGLDLAIQTLMTIFLPLLCFGLWRPRLSSGLLFAATAMDVILLLSTRDNTGDTNAAMLTGSVLFLGVPMLGSAIFLQQISRIGQR